MKNFSDTALRHKNQVEATDPFIILFEFQDNEDPPNRYRITNFDKVVYFGHNSDGDQIPYYPCPVYVGELDESNDGDLKTVGVIVALPGPISARTVSSNGGFAGNPIRIILLSGADIESNLALMDEEGEISDSSISGDGIVFQVGGANLYRLRFPQFIYSPYSCKWGFGSAECGYDVTGGGFQKCGITTAGVQVARPFSIQACNLVGDDEESLGRTRNHALRYGGEPGMAES